MNCAVLIHEFGLFMVQKEPAQESVPSTSGVSVLGYMGMAEIRPKTHQGLSISEVGFPFHLLIL